MGRSVTTRILLADDHPIVRHGLRRLLDAEHDLRVVAEAGDGPEAVALALETQPDLAILDVSMPRLTGIQVARDIARRLPDTKLLMLSMHASEQHFLEALRVGASGYVLKSVADRDLVRGCRATLRGERFIDERFERALSREELEEPGGVQSSGTAVLSPRESEVVKLVAEGHSGREIAEILHISAKTVDRHRGSALEKLGLRDRVDLTRYAIRCGLVEA